MKLGLEEYLYTYNKYNTYAENLTEDIYGSLGVVPFTLQKSNNALVSGSLKDITILKGTADDDYIEIPQNESIQLNFKTADSIIGQIGLLSDAAPATSAQLNIYDQGESASSSYEIKWQHPNGVYYLTATNKTPGVATGLTVQGITIGSGYSFPLFMEATVTITNNSASAEWIRIYHLNFQVNDTVKSGIQTKAIYANYGYRIYYNAQTRTAYRIPANVLLNHSQKDVTWDGDNIFAGVSGRMYERWIDSVSGSARSNGRNAGDVIHQPAGIVESLLRDEIFVERDLTIAGAGSSSTFYIDGLRMVIADYYNNAIIYNVTKNEKDYVTDFEYTGGHKKVTTATNHTSPVWETNDNCYLINVQGDNKIDYASFDVLNNTTNGLRKDWRFVNTLHADESPESILSKLLYEMRAIIFTSHSQYKIVALDEEAGAVNTWTEPLKTQGKYLVNVSLTPVEQLYNDYKIFYDYDFGSGDYRKSLFVNKSGFSSELTSGSTYASTCKDIFDDYKRINKFEYYCDWIKGIDFNVGGGYEYHTVAEYFFDKIFAWYSKQRLIVNWATPVSGYLQYEVGDQVILNNTKLIPTGINNSSKFMIYENPIIPLPGAPIINFKLIEMTGA